MEIKKKIFKSHRLHSELYQGVKFISYTLCIENRNKVFNNDEIAEEFIKELINQSKLFQCDILVYLFMPDHLHLLCEGINDESNSYEMVKKFKQKTGYYFSKKLEGIRWQKSFYDHILRKDEDIKKHINYILNNPVREELCESWKEFPFKGSTVYNFREWE